MYSSTEPPPTSVPHHSIKANGIIPASANYPFLANPPKSKHKPQPIIVRCTPPRTLPRPSSSRRRPSVSGSPAFQSSFFAIVDTPTPTSDTPQTPHLTTHGYTAAFATYPRRGSVPNVQHVSTNSAHRAAASPKPVSPPRSAPSSPKRPHTSGSPKRRQHRVPSPSSPFSPPSPTRTRVRARSTTRIPAPVPRTPPPPRTSKLSKIRSLTNLRARSPSPAPPPKPVMASTPSSTSKPTSKRAKRSATPARGSAAFTKYRPMPFIQQMQAIQLLEGGSLESHIRRHHVHAGQGTAHTGFATGGGSGDIAHGYAFTDERGMIWFDEEEEWEFACLLPRPRPQRQHGIKRLLGKRKEQEYEDDWEEFVDEGQEAEEEEDVDAEVLLAREDDDLRARDDELESFGGALESAWARGRPCQSVLNLPEPKKERKRKTARRIAPSAPAPVPPFHAIPESAEDSQARATALKHEFLATAFVPPPTRISTSPSPSFSPPQSRATSPFRMFGRAPASTDDTATATAPRALFHRHHRHARSVPGVSQTGSTGGQSFASLGATMRGGDVLDAPATVPVPQSPTVQWADEEDQLSLSRASSLAPHPDARRETPSPSPTPDLARLRSVSPPPAAARRLGIEPSTAVSLQPFASITTMKKQPFRNLKGFKAARNS